MSCCIIHYIYYNCLCQCIEKKCMRHLSKTEVVLFVDGFIERFMYLVFQDWENEDIRRVLSLYVEYIQRPPQYSCGNGS